MSSVNCGKKGSGNNKTNKPSKDVLREFVNGLRFALAYEATERSNHTYALIGEIRNDGIIESPGSNTDN